MPATFFLPFDRNNSALFWNSARGSINGDLRQAPNVKRFPKTDVPKLGKIRVGALTHHDAMHGFVSGLRNVSLEMHEECGFEMKALKNGSVVLDFESDADFDVDGEGADDFLYFEGERMIKDYCRYDCSDWTWGFKTYLQYGTIGIAKGRSSQTHEILQRSQWRQANNLHGYRSPEELEDRCDILFSRQLELI